MRCYSRGSWLALPVTLLLGSCSSLADDKAGPTRKEVLAAVREIDAVRSRVLDHYLDAIDEPIKVVWLRTLDLLGDSRERLLDHYSDVVGTSTKPSASRTDAGSVGLPDERSSGTRVPPSSARTER